MRRGVSFQIPNEYGNYLWKILKPFNVGNYLWKMGGESYFVIDGELDYEQFLLDNSVIEGADLASRLRNNQYYAIFVELRAYPLGKVVNQINTYEEFMNSECELVLLLVDSSYVSIYCKDTNVVEKLYLNALKNEFEDVKFITDENDVRTSLTVW
ncbi:DUF2691 family protein [Bacillus sonorensis]|uniref:DUF2691 family protein n=1 Tax=Bacillus sonorensis TaxID=119858 RepID=UPI00227FFAEE|nr:DUF2691 family protein [Bacillus sonorensis]MCY7859479.1 DUF2691 family protein [Bacillus sonorensis]